MTDDVKDVADPSIDGAAVSGETPTQPDVGETPSKGRGILSTLMRVTVSALVGAAILGLTAGGIVMLHARTNTDDGAVANPPVAVDVGDLVIEPSYAATRFYAGRLEPARETDLAFELNGLVTEITVDEGELVAAGAVVARLDTSKLVARRDELRAQKRELRARLDLARATLERQSDLNTKGWSPQQRLDEASFGAAELEAAIERMDASIRTVEIDIGKAELTAPFAGRVATRHLDEGAVVASGTPILNVMEDSRARVRIGVAVDVQDALKVGGTYPLAAAGISHQGRLIAVRPDLQFGTRTVTALFEIESPTGLPFGDIVELTLERSISETGAWVPITALSEAEKGLWTVFVVRETEDGTEVARDAVELLHTEGDRAFVRGGFADGTRYVIDAPHRLTTGQAVTTRHSG